MGQTFNDITILLRTGPAITPCQRQDDLLVRYLCDFYVQHMQGYKPSYCNRVILQPGLDGNGTRSRKIGSTILAPAFFEEDHFCTLAEPAKYRYILELISKSMLQLGVEYGWKQSVFEKTHQAILDKNFIFQLNYPVTLSKSRKMTACLGIEKTLTTCSVYAVINTEAGQVKVTLFQKTNNYSNDCAYILVRHAKWFNEERFGICYARKGISIWYSLKENRVSYLQDGIPVAQIDFKKNFWLQTNQHPQ